MTRTDFHARFSDGLPPYWCQTASGSAFLQTRSSGLLLGNRRASNQNYTNAQIDDYHTLPRPCFPWRPPLRMSIRACFSHNSGQLTGTAGFGFWNHPLRLTGPRSLALPQALWFFYAGPPAHMPVALDQPGRGWKASTIDTRTGRFLANAPLFALTSPLFRAPRIHRSLWPSVQKAAGIAEQLVPAHMAEWHVYTIDWLRTRVRFYLDGSLLLESDHAPAGPLGLVIWIDNQCLQFTPWGRFRWGLVAKEESQWLEIDWLAVEKQAKAP